ncbi:hypothetical protein C1645_825949 [Glomus cerebriforme]|uniref:Uncharacterized protein n=1 Tax=Glomus cerebriforme TaxID=658196 RepID=A0A397SXJ7_9GLOM|nr:hypothetical protein C1645_825949 [Glomus cerebriforme]
MENLFFTSSIGRLGNLGAIDDKYDIAVSTDCPNLNYFVIEDIDAAKRSFQTINYIISIRLPSFNSSEESFTSISIDFVNDKQWTKYQAEKAFTPRT